MKMSYGKTKVKAKTHKSGAKQMKNTGNFSKSKSGAANQTHSRGSKRHA